MMQLPCPHCGQRDEREFRNGGPAPLVRPTPPEAVSDEAWSDYLYRYDDVVGWQAERWVHIHGCGAWFHLWRNTVTHEIGEATLVGQPLPMRPAP